MAKYSLEYCKENSIVLLKPKDYLELYKNYTGVVMSYGMLQSRIKKESIDFVSHEGRNYIMANKYNLSRARTPLRVGTKKVQFTKYRTVNNNSKKRRVVKSEKNLVKRRLFGR
jgi:hypothetical protein